MNSNMYFLQHFSHEGKEKICNDVRKGSRETDRCVEDETNSYSPHLSWDLDENCTHSGVNGREVGDSRAWVFSSICNTGFKQKWKRGKTSDLSTLLFTRGFNEGPLCRLKYTQWKVCRSKTEWQRGDGETKGSMRVVRTGTDVSSSVEPVEKYRNHQMKER